VDLEVDAMKISSPAFVHNTMIPRKYTCQGDDVSPPLILESVPPSAKSLVLVVDDPDAPMGTWDHWIIWNIPVIKEIREGTAPMGAIQGVNSWGNNGYGGPCPPRGVHRYVFKVYALDITLDLDAGSDKHVVEHAMEGHVLAKTELVGLYKKT
jgi:Raf kinase inhibitor-like YbhB/YbcL family protein